MSEPKRTGLLELLRASQGCQFVIPVYQRNYTWKATEQVNQYLSDLENVLKGDYKNHFWGLLYILRNHLILLLFLLLTGSHNLLNYAIICLIDT